MGINSLAVNTTNKNTGIIIFTDERHPVKLVISILTLQTPRVTTPGFIFLKKICIQIYFYFSFKFSEKGAKIRSLVSVLKCLFRHFT